MNNQLKIVLIVFFVFYKKVAYPQPAKCGTERWDVKTLTDLDTSLIDFDNVIQTTVHDQSELTRPSTVKNKPRLNNEATVYELTGHKKEYLI